MVAEIKWRKHSGSCFFPRSRSSAHISCPSASRLSSPVRPASSSFSACALTGLAHRTICCQKISSYPLHRSRIPLASGPNLLCRPPPDARRVLLLPACPRSHGVVAKHRSIGPRRCCFDRLVSCRCRPVGRVLRDSNGDCSRGFSRSRVQVAISAQGFPPGSDAPMPSSSQCAMRRSNCVSMSRRTRSPVQEEKRAS